MTRSRPLQNAFSSGELDPLLQARSDYQRHQTGLARCRGFIPLRQGGFTRSPGTIHRGNTLDNGKARRIPFVFAANDALSLELTDGKMRVWRYGSLVESGGVPYELAIPYDEEQIARLTWVQDRDAVFLADGDHPVQKLSRFALDNWTIADWQLDRGPFRVQNLDEAKTIQASDETGSITLTGVGGPFTADWVGALLLIEPTDFTDLPGWVGNVGASVGERVVFDGQIYELIAGNNTGLEPPTHVTGDVKTSAGKDTVYRHISSLKGIVRITGFTNANSVTADVIQAIPQPCVDDPTYRWSEGAWSPVYGYPRLLGTHGRRLWAANTTVEPRAVWASVPGDFAEHVPSADADGPIAYTLASRGTSNELHWIVSGKKGIYFGALGEVYRGFSTSSTQGIGPLTFDTELVATVGASKSPPIVPHGYPVFITRDKGHVLEARYSFQEDDVMPIDLTLPSQHLGALGIEQIVWQNAPIQLGWGRTSGGELLHFTYDPGQDVIGWSVVPIAGGFLEDLDVVPSVDGRSDIVTLIVRREVNGSTVRMVEELASIYGALTDSTLVRDAIHYFAAQQFTSAGGTPTVFVPHLVGEEVCAWTDKGDFRGLTVEANGMLVLPDAASRVTVGLYDKTHHVDTLPIIAASPEGGTIGRKRRLQGKSGIELHRTSAGTARPITTDLGDAPRIGGAQALFSRKAAGDLTEAVSGAGAVALVCGEADQVQVRFEPVGGAPMTITSFTPTIEEAGA